MPTDGRYQADYRDQGQLTKSDSPTKNEILPSQIKRKSISERTDEPASVTAHAVQAHSGAAHGGIGSLHGPRRECRAIEEDEGKHAMSKAAARKADDPAVHPVQIASTADVVMATVIMRLRPKRCDISLPKIETMIPTKPASVKRTVGAGSQVGAPLPWPS